MGAAGIDEAKLEAFMGQAVTDMGAIISGPLMLIGEKLGLYKAMAHAAEMTLDPEVISAYILKELKTCAEKVIGQPVNDCVITVPARFKEPQKNATREAAKIAKLNPRLIINEPTAAAVAYGLYTGEPQIFVVFDFGGGTFDVSVVRILDEKTVEILGTGGDPHLGGEGGLALFVACGEDPFELLERGAEAVAARLGPACALRRDKPLPDFVDQFGWCTWDAFYQEVSADKLRQGLLAIACQRHGSLLDVGDRVLNITLQPGAGLFGGGGDRKLDGDDRAIGRRRDARDGLRSPDEAGLEPRGRRLDVAAGPRLGRHHRGDDAAELGLPQGRLLHLQQHGR